MSSNPQYSGDQVRAACVAAQDELARAIERAFGESVAVQIGDLCPLPTGDAAPSWSGPGLIFLIPFATAGALVILPAVEPLVPAWTEQPNAAQQDQLRSLAGDVAELMFPGRAGSGECLVGRVPEVAAAVARAQLPRDCHYLPVQISRGESSTNLTIAWPAAEMHRALLEGATRTGGAGPAGEPKPATPASTDPARRRHPDEGLEEGLRQLPPYSRSLLKIPVPVSVTLATSKQPLRTILDLGPGSIIHFNKPCDETLTLEVAGQKFAVGETVKVGDKFGLWITSMILPDERFWVLGARRNARRAK